MSRLRPVPQGQVTPPLSGAFTLVEVLVSFSVVALLTVILASMVNATSSLWGQTRGRIEQFQQAREAFDALTRRLSEATLNTYYDYVDAAGNPRTTANSATFVPARYVRQSELRFLSGPNLFQDQIHPSHAVFFQAPLGGSETQNGVDQLLNTCGFYIELGLDSALLPPVLGATHARERFRLMQLLEPSEGLSVYGHTRTPGYRGTDWITQALAKPAALSPVAENIIALVLLPKLAPQDQVSGGHNDASLAPSYTYDSTASNAVAALNPKNQLPPVVQVTLVAISETSAKRMRTSENDDLKAQIDALFRSVGAATDSSQEGYAKDLQTLEAALVSRNIDYRVFSSNVTLKAAKWSREQKN
jgi:uncharacterized protein (TIGR02599 family)